MRGNIIMSAKSEAIDGAVFVAIEEGYSPEEIVSWFRGKSNDIGQEFSCGATSVFNELCRRHEVYKP